MRWNNNTFGFVLRRMAQLLSDGSKPDKVFKDKDVNLVAKHLKEYSGEADHPKDSEFLNCPIWFYTEIEAIFGHAMATGRFALGSSEALGVNQADSVAAKAEGSAFNHVCEEKTTTKLGGKRKRDNFTEDEMLILTNMSNVVNNVVNALRETRPAHVDANLYLAVMEMLGFSKEALIVAYTYLLDNKAQGRGFVGMRDSHKTLWLRTDLDKN
ncbi:unnamed protein product [Miscanthus lutarioriparius]|uniref:Uncharacterized protein n=1 Tax=Miscanthus lutarioriparius TaxID=422564 RepID=A0A811RR31_9POAL|nr:unnamed protein product [Miscanthus lutarioriparius]